MVGARGTWTVLGTWVGRGPGDSKAMGTTGGLVHHPLVQWVGMIIIRGDLLANGDLGAQE